MALKVNTKVVSPPKWDGSFPIGEIQGTVCPWQEVIFCSFNLHLKILMHQSITSSCIDNRLPTPGTNGDRHNQLLGTSKGLQKIRTLFYGCCVTLGCYWFTISLRFYNIHRPVSMWNIVPWCSLKVFWRPLLVIGCR